MENLHEFYYKKYFTGVEYNHPDSSNSKDTIKASNRKLTATGKQFSERISNQNKWFTIPRPAISNKYINATVDYPGLITGAGIEHQIGVEGEFKLGVHFDYTYGMPVIYGSSVKGVLRSYFDEFYDGKIDLKRLKDAIFGDDDHNERVSRSVYEKDIFFDAVIIAPDSKGRILCSDTLAPHKNEPLKNPKPISFLKIAAGCTIEFRFKLVETRICDDTFIVDDKIKLFENILSTVGIGAKTNVGYGQLTPIE